MGSTATITPVEGPDSPIYMSSVSESDGRLRKPDSDHCYTYHAHPQFVGFSCSGPTYQYWHSKACGVCHPELLSCVTCDDLSPSSSVDNFPLTPHSGIQPQSGVFPFLGYYDGIAVPPELLYSDGSVVLEAFASVKFYRDAYYLYYELGNFTQAPPQSNWFVDAFGIALAKKAEKDKQNKPQSGEIDLPFFGDDDTLWEIICIVPMFSQYVPQSGEMDSNMMHVLEGSTTQVITTLDDDTEHYEMSYDAERDATYYNVDTDEVSLAKFLSRPVKVFQKVYTPNSTVATTTIDVIQPSNYFSNKRVVNRMTNYRNIKLDLCFRFMVNGTPFHYGRWMATAISNSTNEAFLTPTTIQTALNPYKALLSQPPHVFINPTTCQGGCLRLPYVHHFNAFDAPAGEHLATGFIAISELSPLKQLSTVNDPITMTVLCWAENVVLGAPTQSNTVGMVPQSGDEYGKQVTSNTLTVLSRVAGVLSNIVSIRPYAMATQEILTKASRVAIALGFSKPTVVSNIGYMVPRTVPNFSSAVQHDPVYKMTYDDKQEVTHDPSVCGLARVDEMNLKTLMQIPSLISTFGWKSSFTPEQTFLHIKVSPNHFIEGPGAQSAKVLAMPPVSYITQMFRQWRGSLRFRFVAVASSFHRGRLRITYDPNGVTASQVAAGLEYNTTYSYIWDLSENHEAIIDVGYMSHQPYLRPSRPGQIASSTMIAPTALTHDASFDNGSLSITVLNDLTANGVAAADIDILVFLSAGHDFEVYDPTDALDNYTLFPQSGELMQDDLMSPLVTKPHVTFGVYLSEKDRAPLVHHGDSVESLRYLLKRYTTYTTLPFVGIAANSTVSIEANMCAFPLNKGKAPGAMHTAGTQPYNYVYQTPLAWFSAMFMMRRGGLRWRVRDTSNIGLNVNELRAVRNSTNTNFVFIPLNVNTPTSTSASARAYLLNLPSSGAAGMALGSSIDGGRNQVDFEIPYHSARRFASPRLGDNSLAHNQGVKIQTVVTNTTTSAKSGQLTIYVSAADDYSLSGFVSCPPVYYNPTLL